MDYEEYMRSVLGYNQMPNNIYANSIYDNYYYDTDYINNANDEMIESLYPDIYRVVYPMVCKVCNQNNQREITRDLIDRMTDEIYTNIESEDRQNSIVTQRPILKNGDVRNPNAREPEMRNEPRQNNYLMRDLIKILILRELLKRRPPMRPTMRPPAQPPRPRYRPF